MPTLAEFGTYLYAPLLVTLGTVFGGLGVELAKRRGTAKLAKANLQQKEVADARADKADIRVELWEEISRLRERMATLENELNNWRDKYFQLHEQKSAQLAENLILRGENAVLRDRLAHCEKFHGTE